ncbi:MAG: glutamyl-tRNA reductase, partial [Bryobacteraceae bacterium]
MKLALAGVNHSTAPVEVREKLAFPPGEVPDALRAMRAQGAREALILSTCNRVEIAAALDDGVEAEMLVERMLTGRGGMTADEVRPHLYVLEQTDAIRHLFRVASSLDSMIVGEPQILGQLKQAMRQARDQGAIGSLLDAVLRGAFSAAKRVRSETEVGRNAVSVGYAAVELAREIFGSLNKKRVLILGAGKMSEGALRHLVRAGVAEILIANRTARRAGDLARLFHGRAVAFDALPQSLADVDIVIASSAAPGYVLTRDMVRRAIEARKNQPMFLIDIAVPRNIDPEVNKIEHAFLYDMDDLQRLAERNLDARRKIAEQAESIVAEEVARLETRLRERDLAPTIAGLQEQLEAIRRDVLERYRSRMGLLTIDQEEALEALTRGIIGKIAHGPISEIRRHAAACTGGQAHGSEVVSAVRRMFQL